MIIKSLTQLAELIEDALSFAFNASLSSVNVARVLARKEGYNLSVGATKTLMHNAGSIKSMSAKHANRCLKNTDFKELLFYGVRTAVETL